MRRLRPIFLTVLNWLSLLFLAACAVGYASTELHCAGLLLLVRPTLILTVPSCYLALQRTKGMVGGCAIN